MLQRRPYSDQGDGGDDASRSPHAPKLTGAHEDGRITSVAWATPFHHGDSPVHSQIPVTSGIVNSQPVRYAIVSFYIIWNYLLKKHHILFCEHPIISLEYKQYFSP